MTPKPTHANQELKLEKASDWLSQVHKGRGVCPYRNHASWKACVEIQRHGRLTALPGHLMFTGPPYLHSQHIHDRQTDKTQTSIKYLHLFFR